jgi:hypothetical protein
MAPSNATTTDDGLDSHDLPVMSAFGLEAQVEALKEQLHKTRVKCSKQRRELKRLNRNWTQVIHILRRSKYLKALVPAVTSKLDHVDVSGNGIVGGE